jgi:PIN domain nuclease of toxin-antitoxin system
MILLDSHVVLWALTDDPRLGAKARHLIGATATRYVSAVTHAEFAIKAMLGKLVVPDDLADRLAGLGVEGLPFTAAHARGITQFDGLVRHDPFDRMLLAQASVDGLRFVTGERRLLAFDAVVDARL